MPRGRLVLAGLAAVERDLDLKRRAVGVQLVARRRALQALQHAQAMLRVLEPKAPAQAARLDGVRDDEGERRPGGLLEALGRAW